MGSAGDDVDEGCGAAAVADRAHYLAGARAFVEWAQRLPDEVSFRTMDEALAVFAAHLEFEQLDPLKVHRVVQVPPGWVAMPMEPDKGMLERFQSGFMNELRNRKSRTRTAEQAGLFAMLKGQPALPVGWKY